MTDSRGLCRSCGRVMQVCGSGRLRQHRAVREADVCPGSDRPPLDVERVGHFVVYRCFDVHGRLLYIGSTQAIQDRLWSHMSASGGPGRQLSRHLHRLEVVAYPDREATLNAEREAIRAEAPILNVIHNLGRGVSIVPPFVKQVAA